jgi:thioredoxin 1
MKIFAIATIIVGLVFLFSFTATESSTMSDEGIKFQTGTWQQALDLAKKENKIIFLDAYASWCGPCKKMKRTTFADKTVADYYNKNFINVAIDMEKGEGPMLSERYAVEAYPTLIFIKPDGKVFAKTMGFHTVSQFLEVGHKIIKAK